MRNTIDTMSDADRQACHDAGRTQLPAHRFAGQEAVFIKVSATYRDNDHARGKLCTVDQLFEGNDTRDWVAFTYTDGVSTEMLVKYFVDAFVLVSEAPKRTPDALAKMIRPALSEAEQLALAFYMIDQAGGSAHTVRRGLRISTRPTVLAEAWRLFEASK